MNISKTKDALRALKFWFSIQVLLCQDNGAVSIWSATDGTWSKWEQLFYVEEHDDAVMAVDCLHPENEYVTVGADGNIKVAIINLSL